MTFPELPPQLKPISHFLKVAAEHETRDPVVAYWARFHGVQKALEIDKSTPTAKTFLFSMLDWLEGRKKELSQNEAISMESVAEAHIENYALKLFSWADGQDRQAVFNKNVVKAFYTSSILIDVLENFGEVGEEFQNMRKYGKWKAAYIHNCLKNGEVPVPGPLGGSEDQGEEGQGQDLGPPPAIDSFPTTSNYFDEPNVPSNTNNIEIADPTESKLTIEQIAKAQKYCKWASSALNFDDVPTAIENLRKGLNLLENGSE